MKAENEISLRERIRLNLISAMKRADVTQVQLAERLGISKGTVNNWVKGNNSPDVDMVPKICNVLGISILSIYSPEGRDPSIQKANTQASLSISDDAMKLATDYDGLDKHGKRVIRIVADEELDRHTKEQARRDQQRHKSADILPKKLYSIDLYRHPMSAGTGTEAFDEEPEELELAQKPPRGTSYVAPIRGDSMEPDYHDGDMVFVRSQESIEVGQVGVFYMDGQQWIKELGDGVLISYNPNYEPRPMTEDIRCQGLVLGVCDETYFE